MSISYHLRICQESDLPSLAGIYRTAIQQTGQQYYTPAQVAAWSAFAEDSSGFANWLGNAETYVAVDGSDHVLGFASLQQDRISALFVAPHVMHQGIGTALVQQLLEVARRRDLRRLRTEASEFSRPLFEKLGFVVTQVEHNVVRGVAFQRYVMRLDPARHDQ